LNRAAKDESSSQQQQEHQGDAIATLQELRLSSGKFNFVSRRYVLVDFELIWRDIDILYW